MLLSLYFVQGAVASNYPPQFYHQFLTMKRVGSILQSRVANGFFRADFISYSRLGVLAANNPESLDAVLTFKCESYLGSQIQGTSVIKLGREWSGLGYMSAPFEVISMAPPECRTDYDHLNSYQLAISDGRGNWDSNYGHNYDMPAYLGSGDLSSSVDLGYSAEPKVLPKGYELIKAEMQKMQ